MTVEVTFDMTFQHQFQIIGTMQDVTRYFHMVTALDAATMAWAKALLEEVLKKKKNLGIETELFV